MCVYPDEEKMMSMKYKDFGQKNKKNNFIYTCSYNIFFQKIRKVMKRHIGEQFFF